MANIKTTYMGLELKSPIIVAASSISNMIDRIKKAEEAGAGALVIRSLFEEQIQVDKQLHEEALAAGSYLSPEAQSYFPPMEHGGSSEHLMWIEKTRKEVSMPLIGSLNAVSPGAWVSYAKDLENTGVNALELNIYSIEASSQKTGADIEKAHLEIAQKVKSEAGIPVAVKLSPFYTSVANFAHQMDKQGVDGMVLFNRFLQPDININTQELYNAMVLSTPAELKLPLRWVAILYGRVKADLSLTTGVHTGTDMIKALLAGANNVQVAATLLKNGIPYLAVMLRQLEDWMAENNFESLDAFRGKLSQKECADPMAFERAQYVKLIMEQQYR